MALDAYALATQPGGMSFIVNPLDRCAERRGDTEWLARLMQQDDARFVVATAGKLVLRRDQASMRHSQAEAAALGQSAAETAFLGLEPSGAPLFACTATLSDEELEIREELEIIDLRSLALRRDLPEADIGALAQARALTHWHLSHQFCSRCGEKTVMAEAGYRRDCPACQTPHFPRTDPVVIMLITHGDSVLLGRPPRLAEGVYTTLAGFMEPGETIEDAVRRETFEESRVRVGNVRLVLNQPWPFPANLMLGCAGEALTTDIEIAQDELEACRWYSRAEVETMLAGAHPEGHRIPPGISIAHHLILGWLQETAS